MWVLKPSPNASRSEREAYVKQWAALTISIFALLLAINGMYGSSNSSKVLNGREDKAEKQRADMEEISEKARLSEAARDAAKSRSPFFSYAGMALQLSIVLSSAAILAVMMPLLYASIAVGGVGMVLFIYAMVI
jgi:hypothetical protein